jgi:hypothetical protein
MPKHHFTLEQKTFLEKNITGISYDDLTVVFNKRFETNLSKSKIIFCCHRNKLKTGRYVGFIPGVPKKIRPVGSEVVFNKKKKVTIIKVSDEGKTFNMLGTWKRKHVHIYEQAHGKVPKGYKVFFADQNHSNFALDNLLCVSDSVFSYLLMYGLLYTDPELTKTAVAIAKHKITLKEAIQKVKK